MREQLANGMRKKLMSRHAQLIKQQFKELMVQKGTRKIEIINGDNEPYNNRPRAFVNEAEFKKIYY